MNAKCFLFILIISVSAVLPSGCQKTALDSPENIHLLRKIRRFLFQSIGRTGNEERFLKEATRERRLQTQVPDHKTFPCDLSGGRSSKPPTNVNKLRPGDIDVIGAMGDSLTAGLGIFSTNILHLVIENRGVSALGGGQGTWRQYLTIPNILKEYNPKLIGYATGDSMTIEKESEFNVAESGAMSIDIPYMSTILLQRIKNNPKVDIKNHWKLINIMIGSNDFCLNICYEASPWDVLEQHKSNLLKVLRTLRDNLPRTLVSIVNTPHLKTIIDVVGRSPLQEIAVKLECPCLFGDRYRKNLEEYYQIMTSWRKLEDEISQYPEFKRDDFGVITQPFTANVSLPKTSRGKTDLSYLATDTFHVSQKTNARFANSLWNNFLEPVGNKTLQWTETFGRFLCPTLDRPYLSTLYN